MVIRSLGDGAVLWVLDVEELCVCVAWLMIKTALARWLTPPPLPAIANVNDPVGVLAGSVTVSVEAKFGVAEGTLKTALAPEGAPVTVNETCELKPFIAATLTVYDTVCPWSTLWDAGLTLIWKSGAWDTIKVTGAECDTPPPIPETVSVIVPDDAEEVVVTVRVELKGGVPDVGPNETETPAGGGVVKLKATLCAVPDTKFTVTA
jgi:hypothetical protein